MKPLWKAPADSIFYKIVMTFLGLLVPLCGLNFMMNDSGASIVRDEITRSMEDKVKLYVHLIESDFVRVIELVQTYVNDEDLMMLSTAAPVMTEVEKTEAILALKQKIDLVKSSSRFVENASAFIPLLDRTVSSNDNYIAAFDREQFEALAVTTNRYEAPFLLWDDRLFVSVPYPDPALTEGARPPQFLLTVEVSERALRETLRQFTNNGEVARLAVDSLRWSIRSDGVGEIAPAESGDLFVVSHASERIDASLSISMPKAQAFGPLHRYRTWLLWIACLSAIVVVFFAFSVHRIIDRPLRTLVRSLGMVEKGNLQVEVSYPRKDEFGFLYNRFNAMVKQLNVLVHEVYEQQYRVRLAELRQLQSQINPHFLYNSFFLLHRMATLQDNDNIARFTSYLGDYFRFITRDGESDTRLDDEANHARTYTEIQAFRFGPRIRAEFGELPPEAAELRVPRLILQPLIENAYTHGLEKKTKDGRLRVGFRTDGNALSIVVEDNGETLAEDALRELRERLRAPETSAESTGLLNVHRRLRIRYGAPYGLSLERSIEGGLLAELRIPLEKEGEMTDVPLIDRR
ncbi:sensor histidine kinase [Paenibacillus sp.]|uniref:sensor histidine kinase n=1 Tax=Paenibacillus sp. TaxID=58172 RepID=UPI002D23C9F8|nr:histidine kinase [Paenibacillus sp.]HZG88180.1 histidine kinase [Paenibacillus sp.]